MIKHAVANVFNEPDSYKAGKLLIKDLMSRLNNEQPDILILFFTVAYDVSKIIKAVQEETKTPLIGCSATGIITSHDATESAFAVSIMGIKSNDVKFYPFIYSEQSPDKLGEDLATLANSHKEDQKQELILMFIHGNGISTNIIFSSLEAKAQRHINCIGGAASNNYITKKTFQFNNSTIIDNGIVGFYMCGDFNLNYAVSHGGEYMGLTKTITKATGNKIYSIDNMTAIDAIKKYCGTEPLKDFSTLLFHVYFAVPQHHSFDEIKLRAILDADIEKGYVVVGAELPVGTKFKFGRREKSKVLACTKKMGEEIMSKTKNKDEALYIYINCVGRGAFLFGNSQEDVNELFSVIGRDINLMGYFSFGEIAPYHGENEFHNFTGVIASIE